jgi:hypothetical protein
MDSNAYYHSRLGVRFYDLFSGDTSVNGPVRGDVEFYIELNACESLVVLCLKSQPELDVYSGQSPGRALTSWRSIFRTRCWPWQEPKASGSTLQFGKE